MVAHLLQVQAVGHGLRVAQQDRQVASIPRLLQLSRALGSSTEDTMQMLSMMGINVIDYDFKEDLSAMDAF